jgi:ornithine cyclodeaminase
MRVFGLQQILDVFDEAMAMAAIRQAFVDFALGRAQVAAVGHLQFADPRGDCHVKSARLEGVPIYVVKVASSFYDNPRRGVASSQGAMIVISAETGTVLGVLADEGHLTDQRTALTGVLAARAIQRPGSRTLGIVGTGTQGALHARLFARHGDFEKILIWGRNPEAAARLADEVNGEVVDVEQLCRRADLIVTTTPSTVPLIRSDWIGAGQRIVAVGADTPGKQELDAAILGRARVVVDSAPQCLDCGEASWAHRAGLLAEEKLIELGRLFLDPVAFDEEEIVVVDLTGVAVQDLAVASSVWMRLASGAR